MVPISFESRYYGSLIGPSELFWPAESMHPVKTTVSVEFGSSSVSSFLRKSLSFDSGLFGSPARASAIPK